MTLPSDPPEADTAFVPFNTPRDFPPPPFLKALGLPDSVRTPLGHYRTESLFLERWRPIDGQRPAYTLQRDDREDPRVPGRILPSFQDAYIKFLDPSGYQAATQLLGSWRHWQKLVSSKWFNAHVELWNEEIVAALRSKGLATYIAQANDGDLKAADWLSGYSQSGPAEKPKRGRPSTHQIQQAATDLAEQKRNREEDAARVGIGV